MNCMTNAVRSISTVAGLILLGSSAIAEPAMHPIVGSWASGETADSCDTAPITHFMSDGVVTVFLQKDGELHSIGAWSATETQLTMTHNDFPLKSDGVSNTPVTLEISELDEIRFVTRNSEGAERSRVRCSDIEITMGDSHTHD